MVWNVTATDPALTDEIPCFCRIVISGQVDAGEQLIRPLALRVLELLRNRGGLGMAKPLRVSMPERGHVMACTASTAARSSRGRVHRRAATIRATSICGSVAVTDLRDTRKRFVR
jgi:hypothetical protein